MSLPQRTGKSRLRFAEPAARRAAPPPPSPPPPPRPQPQPSARDRAVETLALVRSGQVAGGDLTPETRQQLVMLLSSDGVSNHEIAQILKVADRTVERDRRAIREQHAVEKDPQLVAQLVGQLMAEAQLTCQRIRRVARDKEVPPAVRVDAEHKCFVILDMLTDRMQRLGYLPTATQKLDARLSHAVVEVPPAEALVAELARVRQIAGGSEHEAGLLEVEDLVGRASAATRLARLGRASTEFVDTTADEAQGAPVEPPPSTRRGGRSKPAGRNAK